MEPTERSLIDFCNDWDIAMAGNNAEAIGSFMSDDWVCVGNNGITGKAAFLAFIASGDLEHTIMQSDELHVRIYGKTGIVTAKGTSAGNYKGEPFHLYEWSTNVFLFDNDRWQCVHTMLTSATK